MNVRPAIILLCILLLRSPAVSSDPGSTHNETWRWKTLSSPHFDLYYPGGLEDLALKAADLAESGYIRVADCLGHDMKNTIPLILYPAGHVHGPGPVPPGSSRRFDITGPRGTAKVSFNGSYADLRRDITRETALVFQYAMSAETPFHVPKMTSHRIPFWLAEGMARYCASGFDRTGYLLLRGMIRGKRYEGLRGPSGMSGAGMDECAAMGQAFCWYIEKQYGREALGEIIRDFRDIGFFDEALSAKTGKSVDELDRDLAAFIAGLYRHETTKNFRSEHGTGSSEKPARVPQREVLVGRSGGSPCLIVRNTATGRTVNKIPVPFDEIRHPSLSRDGKDIAFSAVAGSSEDIFIIEIKTRSISRITDDDFSDRHPSITPDGNSVRFSSNYNPGGDPSHPVYRTNQINIRTGKRALVADEMSGQAETDSPNDGVYRDPDPSRPGINPVIFHEPYASPSEYAFDSYRPAVKPGWIHLGTAGALNNEYLCYLQAGLADALARHRLVLTANYLRVMGRNDINASLAYTFRSGRLFLDVGLFRQGNPLNIVTFSGLMERGPLPALGLGSMEHYGGYGSVNYRPGRSFNLGFGAAGGRYEKHYRHTDQRNDLRMTFARLSVTAEYDSRKWAHAMPINGSHLLARADQTFDLNGKKPFTSLGIHLSHCFPLGRNLIFALRGSGAMLPGPNRGGFKLYLGGFDSLRGYGLNSLSGRNMFLASAEFRFTPVDWQSFGIPRRGGLGNIAAVLFLDAGSAWSGGYRLIDKNRGRFDDLKMDFGAGIRAAVSPLLILKLDFAWPFDNKSIKPTVITFSMGFDY